jgi:hypothetical protein
VKQILRKIPPHRELLTEGNPDFYARTSGYEGEAKEERALG